MEIYSWHISGVFCSFVHTYRIYFVVKLSGFCSAVEPDKLEFMHRIPIDFDRSEAKHSGPEHDVLSARLSKGKPPHLETH